MLLIMLSLDLFKKLIWLLWGIIDDLSHLGFVTNKETYQKQISINEMLMSALAVVLRMLKLYFQHFTAQPVTL